MGMTATSDIQTDKRDNKGRSKLAARFRNVNILFVVFILVVMIALSAFISNALTDSVSMDYVRFYTSDSVNILSTYLSKEISLVQHTAESREVIEWFADENNPQKKHSAYSRMMHTADMLQIKGMYFAISGSLNEYEINSGAPFDDFKPFNTLDLRTLYDQWFVDAINSESDFTLNLDVDKVTDTRRLWINYK